MNPENQHIAYYINSSAGKSIPLPLESIDGSIDCKKSIIRCRKNSPLQEYVSPLGYRGFPGVPYEQGVPNPDTYYQGEDIVLDSMLVYLGEMVDHNKYTISVVVKPDPHSLTPTWVGSIDNGIYSTDRVGFYQIWIPSATTQNLFAGSYYLDVILKEHVGKGAGVKDRTMFLLTYIFNVEYSAGSKHPENSSNSGGLPNRGELENTWPPAADIIGTSTNHNTYTAPSQYPL